jgi:transglutaminase-like putative cysteine protease
MSKFKIRHLTHYVYEGPVRDSANQIMLYPLRDEFVDVLSQDIRVSGDPSISIHQDYFGNDVGTFTQSPPHQELIIDSRLDVVTRPRPLPTDPLADTWESIIQLKNSMEFMDFVTIENFASIGEIRAVVDAQNKQAPLPLELAQQLCAYVNQNFSYKKGITTVESTVDEVWTLKSGVCQDFAQILLVMLRLKMIPARYVSGYICPNTNAMRGEGATHAWVEVYMPSTGWFGLDPTNNCFVNENHVRLAVGRNFTDCSPVRGTYRGAFEHTLDVEVTVSYEDGNKTPESAKVNSMPEKRVTISKNSYRRNQEMQQQQ